MNLTEEKQLVAHAKNDPEAFGKLFDFYYSKILHFAVHRTGEIEAAKDITSQVFVKVLKHLRKFEWREVSFSAWIYRIATNEINDYFRRGKRRYTHSLETMMQSYGFEIEDTVDIEKELVDAETEIERHQLFLRVQHELSQMKIHYQEVLALRYFEHKSVKEISEILAKKEGTVKSLLSRGLVILRTKLLKKNETKVVKILKMQPIKVLNVLKVEEKQYE